jgi:RNA polymerase sigma-70 factor (ECF subfamily)
LRSILIVQRSCDSRHYASQFGQWSKNFVQFSIFAGSIGRIFFMSSDSSRPLGDQSAAQQRFLSLFLRSEREVFRYVAALVPNISDAEDIVQQTAIALWEKFDAYDPAQPFTPWACRFALNKARQWIERRQRWQTLLEGGVAEELAQRREELRPELEVRLRNLEGCLDKLPGEQRSIVEGYYYHRTAIEKLAVASGRTVEATYKALQRIRLVLQACVENAAKPGEAV